MDVRNTLLESLGIKILKVAPDEVVATMPVDGRTMQPFGYLHGGATAALLETVASLGAIEYADLTRQSVFGTHLDIHHVRSARDGIVTGTATPITIGDDEQLWSVESRNEEDAVLSTGTVTVRVVAKR